jgi:hypothetical protein
VNVHGCRLQGINRLLSAISLVSVQINEEWRTKRDRATVQRGRLVTIVSAVPLECEDLFALQPFLPDCPWAPPEEMEDGL